MISTTPGFWQPVVAGSQSGVLEASQVTLRTEAEWRALQAQIGAPEPQDPIDFETQMVLVAFGGLHQSRFGLEWFVSFLSPPTDRGALTTATWTEMHRLSPASPRFGGPQEETPYIVVVVDRHDGPVAWTKNSATLP